MTRTAHKFLANDKEGHVNSVTGGDQLPKPRYNNLKSHKCLITARAVNALKPI